MFSVAVKVSRHDFALPNHFAPPSNSLNPTNMPQKMRGPSHHSLHLGSCRSPMTTALTGVAVLAVATAVAPVWAGGGGAVDGYVVFGRDQVRIGNFASFSSGLVGSNQLVVWESGGATADGVVSGGNVMWGGPTIGTADRPGQLRAGGSIYYDAFGELYGDLLAAGNVAPLAPTAGLLVHGDVTAGGTVAYSDFFSEVSGTITENATPAPEVAQRVLPVATSFSAGGVDHFTGTFDETTLTPGSYGQVVLGASNTLHLTSGDYFLETLTSQSFLDLSLTINDGPINLYVEGNILIESVKDVAINDQVLNGPNPPAQAQIEQWASLVTIESAGSIHYGGDLVGTVFAPHGTVVVDTFGTIVGGLLAEVVDMSAAGGGSAGVAWAQSARLFDNGALAGDVNQDGAVDGLDVEAWQMTYGGQTGFTLRGAPLVDWQRNLHRANLAAAVPEPSTTYFAVLGHLIAGLATTGRRRGSPRGRKSR